MPSRGYRKGISDAKRPRPHVIKSRTATSTYQALHAEAQQRAMTFSELIDAILDAHTRHQRPELPHPRGLTTEALRELARQGNNVNQIAHQANAFRLPHIQDKALQALDAINRAATRLTP